jgi:hypothetical protein
MRNAAAWIIGIIVFAVIYTGAEISLSELGIETYVDFGREVCDRNMVCNDGKSTDIANLFLLFSCLVGLAAGRYIVVGSYPFFSTPPAQRLFNVWFLGSLVASMTGTFLMQIVPEPFNSWALLVLMLVTAVVGYNYFIANTTFDYLEDEDEYEDEDEDEEDE